VPQDLVSDHDPNFSTLKLKLGEDEVVLLLRKEHVPSLSSYLNRLENRSLDPSSVEVKPSPTGGLGLFATKDFLPGDLVLSERPMVSELSHCRSSSGTDRFAYHIGLWQLVSDKLSTDLLSADALYKKIVDRCLSPFNKARFMSLAASHPTILRVSNVVGNIGKSVSIVTTNSYDIFLDLMLDREETGAGDDTLMYYLSFSFTLISCAANR
jgi:hypothetical protein